MSGLRRALAVAVLLCAAGAGLAVFAATRVWSVEVTARPTPLPALRVTHTGGDLLPWLPALAVVGLAGAGAVLATRAAVRRVVAVLLLLVGLGVAGGGAYGATALDRADAGPTWPALCALGGLLAAGGAALTALRGYDWPGLGARYERRAGRGVGAPIGSRAGGRGTTYVWDALDRGEDPTDDDASQTP